MPLPQLGLHTAVTIKGSLTVCVCVCVLCTLTAQVFVLCFLCVLFLLIRGAANLLAVTRVMDNCDGFFLPPHSACSYSPKFELYTMCFDVVSSLPIQSPAFFHSHARVAPPVVAPHS